MSNCKDIDKILERNGMNQKLTYNPTLEPNSIEIHNFNQTDWILFAYNLAQKVNFFDTSNNALPVSNWQDFFKAFGFTDSNIPEKNSREYFKLQEKIKKSLNAFEANSSLTPHLCLFTCFTHLLEHSKKRMNALSTRHLDFYYNEILQENKLPAQPDKAHVLFTLAKKTLEHKVEENAKLNAKKDENGEQRTFKTSNELVVNQSSIETIKTTYNDVTKKEFKISPAAKTLDGIKEELPEESPYWLPFAYTSGEPNFMELPSAKLGFTLASPILKMSEGRRLVFVQIKFKGKTLPNKAIPQSMDLMPLFQDLEIQCTGAKKWFKATLISSTPSLNIDDQWATLYTDSKLNLLIEIPKEMEAFENYQEEVYMEGYKKDCPLLRLKINTKTNSGYQLFSNLSKKTIEEIKIDVSVEDKRELEIQNDFGKLKATKPFYPFTPDPKKDSNFSIYSEEIFSKNWKNISIQLKWKNAPESFSNLYAAYNKSINENSFQATVYTQNKKEWEEEKSQYNLFQPTLSEDGKFSHQALNIQIFNSNKHFLPNLAGPIKISLEQSFLQKEYPLLLAKHLSDKMKGIAITQELFEPYIPIAEELSVNYFAQETIHFQTQTLPITDSTPLAQANTKETYESKNISLLHEFPFGFAEEHGYLKYNLRENGIISAEDMHTSSCGILPKFCHGGNLYIGIKDAKALDNISLLIQVLEGTENPMAPSFKATEKIEWSVLCSNKWKLLQEEILKNKTDNFLKSGIIEFQVPKQATINNTLLPEGLIWVKASMHKDYDAICKVVDIHTNAVSSEYELENDFATHLQSGLPQGTISKLIERVPQIKSVEQPYSSFGGKDKESQNEFYRRVSERLRHKDRAITLWDYEHLILQEFRDIYKAKCLNHTKLADEDNPLNNFFAPGNVTIVVVPDTKNRNVFDIYQPRVSKGLLNEVQEFIGKRVSSLIHTEIVNPTYEEVKIKLEVEFIEGKDANFYKKELSKDITKFLSPWAFDSSLEIVFDQVINHSVLVSYMEKLDYVDYLQNIQMFKNNVLENKEIKPSHPASILVSAKQHEIDVVLTNCQGEKPKDEVLCKH